MNSKMTTNSQLPTTEPKKQKQTKETTKQEQNRRYGDHMKRENGGKGTGNKKHNW